MAAAQAPPGASLGGGRSWKSGLDGLDDRRFRYQAVENDRRGAAGRVDGYDWRNAPIQAAQGEFDRPRLIRVIGQQQGQFASGDPVAQGL